MNDDFDHSKAAGCGCEVSKVVREGLLVALAGVLLALAANAVSPRGLALTRNLPTPRNNLPTTQVPTAQQRAAQLRAAGLKSMDLDQAVQRFRDPRLAQEKVIFVDARDEERYRAGHVPGAFELDPYRPEAYLAVVLPVCQAADEIVLYCHGGDCEDSELAAVTLREAGIPGERLHVYMGGLAEWAALGLPVETGARNSGVLRQPTK